MHVFRLPVCFQPAGSLARSEAGPSRLRSGPPRRPLDPDTSTDFLRCFLTFRAAPRRKCRRDSLTFRAEKLPDGEIQRNSGGGKLPLSLLDVPGKVPSCEPGPEPCRRPGSELDPEENFTDSWSLFGTSEKSVPDGGAPLFPARLNATFSPLDSPECGRAVKFPETARNIRSALSK